jgi:hypothetical protein
MSQVGAAGAAWPPQRLHNAGGVPAVSGRKGRGRRPVAVRARERRAAGRRLVPHQTKPTEWHAVVDAPRASQGHERVVETFKNDI